MSKNDTKKTEAQTASKESRCVSVRILKHRTKVGGVICAKGARINLSEEKAKQLVELGMAEILGI